MGFIGAAGAIATLVFAIKCGRRAVDGIEDKKCWAYLLLSMLAMSIGTSWPDMYMGIGMFFLLAWWAYLANWLYKLIAHKVAKREKATKKDFWMPIACFALMIVAVAITPEKKVDDSSLVAESVSSSVAVSGSVEEKPNSQEATAESKQAEQEAERNEALKAESERRAAEAAASSKKEEPASKEQSASEKAKEEERNAAIRAESEKRAARSKAAAEKKTSSASTSTVELSEDEYKAKCVEVDYKDLCRYPERYSHKKIKIKAKIQQVMDASLLNSSKTYRVQTDTSGYGWYLDDEYFVTDKRTSGSVKLLEDDVIVIYGEFSGMEKVTRALTWTTDEVPGIQMKYAELVKE